MAERARNPDDRAPFPRSRTFGGAAKTAGQRFSILWSRESVLRLVLSFVLATALWLYVTGKQTPSLAVAFPQAVPVAYQSLNPALTVTNTLPSLHIRIRNNPEVLVTQSSFHPFVDLSRLGAGVYRHVPIHMVTDPGIQVVGFTPTTIPVAIEPLQQKSVRVIVHILNPPPEGYSVGTIQVQPSTVAVSGARSIVSQVAQAGIYLDLSTARFSIQGAYRPYAETSQNRSVVNKVTIQPIQVTVNVRIKALSTYKTLPVLVPIQGQPRAGYGVSGLTVQPAEITAKGSRSALSKLTAVSTYPVSIAHHGAGSFSTRVKIRLPSGVQSDTAAITVRLQLAPVESSSSIEIGISPHNLAPGLVVHTSPAKILVTVVGSSSKLHGAADRMRAVINLANLGSGTYALTPIVNPPAGLRVEGIYPNRVTVVIGPGSSG